MYAIFLIVNFPFISWFYKNNNKQYNLHVRFFCIQRLKKIYRNFEKIIEL